MNPQVRYSWYCTLRMHSWHQRRVGNRSHVWRNPALPQAVHFMTLGGSSFKIFLDDSERIRVSRVSGVTVPPTVG